METENLAPDFAGERSTDIVEDEVGTVPPVFKPTLNIHIEESAEDISEDELEKDRVLTARCQLPGDKQGSSGGRSLEGSRSRPSEQSSEFSWSDSLSRATQSSRPRHQKHEHKIERVGDLRQLSTDTIEQAF